MLTFKDLALGDKFRLKGVALTNDVAERIGTMLRVREMALHYRTDTEGWDYPPAWIAGGYPINCIRVSDWAGFWVHPDSAVVLA